MNAEEFPDDDWRRIREAVVASAGWLAHGRIKAITRSHRILDRNAAELARLLHFLDTPQALPIWDAEHPERLNAFLDDVTRCLHNFVASVRSLVDHTRNLMTDTYAGDDPLLVTYQAKVESTFLAPFPQFVSILRNYLLHYRLPATSATMNFTGEGPDGEQPKMTAAIVLERASLLEYDGWNATARQYLKASDEDINFDDVVHEYLRIVNDFYQWLVEGLNAKHAQDIAETNRLIEQEHQLLRHDEPGEVA